MSNIAENLRLMLIENLASAASHRGGLDETEALNWAEAQSAGLLNSHRIGFDELEQLALTRSAADIHWLKFLLRL